MSRRQQMELRVNEILDAGSHEDLFVEFKRELPADCRKSARRIAGLANAARGSEVVWIVGVDDNGNWAGATDFELSDWWPQVQRCFDDVPPDLEEIVVARPEGPVLGMFFRTDRAPYVWKTGGSPEYEVSWRDGTRTRAARRLELLRILAPARRAPQVEIIGGSVTLAPSSSYDTVGPDDPETKHLRLEVRVAMFVDCADLTSFPTHRQRVRVLNAEPFDSVFSGLGINWRVEGHSYGQFRSSAATAHIEVPSTVTLYGIKSLDGIPWETYKAIGELPTLSVEIELHASGVDIPSILQAQYLRDKNQADKNERDGAYSHLWRFDPLERP